jgi:DNA-directed RNA polymerase specialized sigma24 family protein
MLGSLSEVDDAVQEAWLRLSRADATGIDNLGGWLTTVVARVCLDMLRSRQSRREEPLTPDAPKPVATGTRGTSPEQEALLADSVGLALFVVLDRLTPAERLAFVLHDMFAVPFEEIEPIVGRSAERRRVSSPAGRAAAFAGARQHQPLISFGSARSSRPFLRHYAPATSKDRERQDHRDRCHRRSGAARRARRVDRRLKYAKRPATIARTCQPLENHGRRCTCSLSNVSSS